MILSQKYFTLLFFLLTHFLNLNLNAEPKNINYFKDSQEKLKAQYFPITKINGNLFFTLGALSKSTSSESLLFTYENKIKLNTSFNGKDSLSTVFESGNAMNNPFNLDLQSKKGDKLQISTILYKFNLDDKYEAIIGPKMFGYHGLAGKSTAYNERIAILDGSNYTTSSGLGPGMGISRKSENGFNTSLKIASNSSIINDDSLHFISQVGLTKNSFGGTITNNLSNDFNAYGIAAFYRPKNFPSISASIEFKDDDSTGKIKNWVFGLQKSLQNKKLGIAMGTYDKEERICYEGWSEIDITDKFKIIPVFFAREKNNPNTELGFSINTKFSY